MSYKRSSGKVWTGILAVLLVIVIIGVVAGVGILSDGFKDWSRFETEQEQPADDDTADNGGMIVDTEEGSRITLKATAISAEEYADYGISAQAESAQLLTATLEPANATYTTAVWSVSWSSGSHGYGAGDEENAGGGVTEPELRAATASSDSWSEGKTVTDYVTVTPTEENALTATVENLQAFGEQIIITLTVTGENTASATCTVDYAQKVTDVLLTLGSEIVFNFSSGQATVPLQVNADGIAPGGAAVTSVMTSAVYTLADSFSVVSYKFTDLQHWCVHDTSMGMGGWLAFADYDVSEGYDYSVIENYSIEENGLYFGLQFFADNLGLHYFSATRSAPDVYEVFSNDSTFWEERFEKVLSSFDDGTYSYYGTHLFDIEVTLKGTYSTYTAVLDVSVGSIVNTVPLSGVGLDQDSVVF